MTKKRYRLICPKCNYGGHSSPDEYCWAKAPAEDAPATPREEPITLERRDKSPAPPTPKPHRQNITFQPSEDKAWDSINPERLLSLPRWATMPVIRTSQAPKSNRVSKSRKSKSASKGGNVDVKNSEGVHSG